MNRDTSCRLVDALKENSLIDENKKVTPKKVIANKTTPATTTKVKKKPAKKSKTKKKVKVSTTPESTKQQHAEWDVFWSGLSELEKTEHLGKMFETRYGVEEWENCNAFYSADDYAKSEDTFIEYNEEY